LPNPRNLGRQQRKVAALTPPGSLSSQWMLSYLNLAMSNNWRASLVPAAAVIPAPVAYTNIAAVKKLVVEFRVRAAGCSVSQLENRGYSFLFFTPLFQFGFRFKHRKKGGKSFRIVFDLFNLEIRDKTASRVSLYSALMEVIVLTEKVSFIGDLNVSTPQMWVMEL